MFTEEFIGLAAKLKELRAASKRLMESSEAYGRIIEKIKESGVPKDQWLGMTDYEYSIGTEKFKVIIPHTHDQIVNFKKTIDNQLVDLKSAEDATVSLLEKFTLEQKPKPKTQRTQRTK